MNHSSRILNWWHDDRLLGLRSCSMIPKTQRSPRNVNTSRPFSWLTCCLLFCSCWRSLISVTWSNLVPSHLQIPSSSCHYLSQAKQLNLKIFVILIVACAAHSNPWCSLRAMCICCLLINSIDHVVRSIVFKSIKLACKHSRVTIVVPSCPVFICW